MDYVTDQRGNLCSRCSSIPLEAYFSSDIQTDKLELGNFQNIMSRQLECQFCCLVIEAFHGHLYPNWEPGVYPNQMCYLRAVEKNTQWKQPEVEVYCNVTTENMPNNIFGSHQIRGFIGLAPESNDACKLPVISNRPLNHQNARSWILNCEVNHKECHLNNEAANKDYKHIWLVDVQEMCLVERAWNCRYVALSYVWGQHTAFRTEMSTVSELKCPNSLQGLLHKIPQVVKDAIRFVGSIQERYLWVDSLCIVQDDEEFKKKYIPRMHRVYQSAIVTLVDLAGEGASAGLAGVSTECKISNIPITVGSRILEEIFSRKCIYFTDYQAYWACQSSCTPESGHNDTYGKPKLWSYSSWGRIGDEVETQFLLYQQLVKGYSNRELTFHADSLNAFEGIITELKDSFGWTFLSALPEDLFGFALHWVHPYGSLLRPRPSSDQSSTDPLCRSPTWCWTAWRGFVYWDPWHLSSFVGKQINLKFEIESFWFADSPEPRRIMNTNGVRSGSGALEVPAPELRCDDSERRTLNKRTPNNAILFNAKVVHAKVFAISPPNCDKSYSRYFRCHQGRAGWIYDKAGHHCGTLRGIDFWISQYDKENWEIVLLSRSFQDEVTQADIDAYPHLPLEYPSRTEYYEDIFDTSFFNYKTGWALNIMLVDRKGAWVERLAIGQIHVDAWESASVDTSMKMVVLW
ncbi:heterokaryon incompatibility protein [Colletotrichum truncatum]|uniref:Heterokaryon incompatibility protein n=1 Tax=Colletotrichum truncatum TaxID=5467 RepID=A0ACC3ZHQ6_COLTU